MSDHDIGLGVDPQPCLIHNPTGLHPSAIRELALLTNHSHPNLIPLLDMIRTKDKLVLVYPYQKYNLDRIIRGSARQGLTPNNVRWYTFQLLRAVGYLHSHSVMHRDIKPENVLVGEVRGVRHRCIIPTSIHSQTT